MPLEPSSGQKLARILLDREPGEWINEKRDAGISWRRITYELAVATDGELVLSDDTVKAWHTRWVREQFVARVEAEVGGAA